jgi:DNA-binding response OmpR family regulator
MMVAEVEPPEGLSARKLVLETGKFNVITAYSVEEAFETLGAFPRVDAVVLHASLCKEMECDRVVAEIKKRHPNKVVITLSPTNSQNYKLADHQLSSHEPQQLLNLLRERFGDPRSPAEKP